MDLTEATVHSFIVKLWLENEGEANQIAWRGHITHVPSGARRYVKALSDITDFITQYIDGTDVHIGFKSKVRGWLKRLNPNPSR